jgi:hypothetical protein
MGRNSYTDLIYQIQKFIYIAFVASDFGFTDPDYSPPKILFSVKLTNLPSVGKFNFVVLMSH